jgi:hypothetical protein
MTLDEMIAYMQNEWCVVVADSAPDEHDCREHAATLLTIENALRAVRDGVAV